MLCVELLDVLVNNHVEIPQRPSPTPAEVSMQRTLSHIHKILKVLMAPLYEENGICINPRGVGLVDA